jgi:hypothetical protein
MRFSDLIYYRAFSPESSLYKILIKPLVNLNEKPFAARWRSSIIYEDMVFLSGGFYKIITFVFAALTIALTLPRLSPVVFPRVSEPSPAYDCDDATLDMYRYFQDLGIEATPIVGNLDIENEDYDQCNHVWLLVKSGDREIAYDWGIPRFDRQHYEGYTISLDNLLYAVNEDRAGSDSLVASGR